MWICKKPTSNVYTCSFVCLGLSSHSRINHSFGDVYTHVYHFYKFIQYITVAIVLERG